MIPGPEIAQQECYTDPDCPGDLSCIGDRCENMCLTQNPCQGNLQCSVTESYDGKKTVACMCPPGTIATSQSLCEEGTHGLHFIAPLHILHYFACSFSESGGPVSDRLRLSRPGEVRAGQLPECLQGRDLRSQRRLQASRPQGCLPLSAGLQG